ncbi:MAG TPA: cyanophycinase, partial [Kofleriaceae bacterium]|nr:cyanophycinase [Kofleriaceae bacterium]
ILTTSSDPARARENGRFYEEAFRARGAAVAEWIPLTADHPARADDPALAERVRGYDVFFFGGGDQTRYTRVLLREGGRDSAVLAAMREVFTGRGAVIAGTSAGAAALVSAPMVTGGESHDALARPRRLRDRPAGGLGFFRWGLIDTHFAERGRQGRLIRLAARRDVELAFGVDEDTALVVERPLGDRPRFRVIGRGGVGVFDLARARYPRGGRFRIEGVRAHYLTRGDRYDPRTRRPSIARWKQPDARPRGARRADRADLFSAVDPATGRRARPRAFVRTSMAASSSRAPVVGHPAGDPSWVVTVRRGRGAGRFRGVDRGRAAASYRNMRVDIRPRARR